MHSHPPSANHPRVTPMGRRPVDQEVIDAYQSTGSVWAAAELLGIAGQTVHKRLRKLGKSNPMRRLTEAEKSEIELLYSARFERGNGCLDDLCRRLGRTKPFVSRYAKSVGLTNRGRPACAESRMAAARTAAGRWTKYPHPRGALGMKHTEATKMKVAWSSRAQWDSMTSEERSQMTRRQLKTRLEKYGTLAPPRSKVSWKQGWRDLGGTRIYYRSRWEYNYAVYLQWLLENNQILKWEHEPETFWFEGIRRGCITYLPDFRVTFPCGGVEYHEVKGWMDSRSKTKLKRMAKYHPSVKLRVIDGKWFRANGPKLAFLNGWER